MTIIRVDPASVQAYGNDAQTKFDTIRAELQALVNAVSEVRYFGPNAVEFKTRSGEMAAEFATQVNADLGAIADAVRTSTSNIAASLGGSGLSLSVSGAPIVPPAVADSDFVDVDTTALEQLKGVIDSHFQLIVQMFEEHLNRLAGTDWEGNAKQEAVTNVQGFTQSAKHKSAEAQTSLNNAITAQIEAVVTADR